MQASPVVRPHVNPTPPPPRVNRANTPKLSLSPQPLHCFGTWKVCWIALFFSFPADGVQESWTLCASIGMIIFEKLKIIWT